LNPTPPPHRRRAQDAAIACGRVLRNVRSIVGDATPASGYRARFAWGAGPNRLPASNVELLVQFFRLDPRLFRDREVWESLRRLL